MKNIKIRFKCPNKLPVSLKNRSSETDGVCWRVEKVSRKDKDGYATAFYNKKSGKPVGYGRGYITSGGSVREVCGATLDREAAAIKARGTAAIDGELCVSFTQGKAKKKARKV